MVQVLKSTDAVIVGLGWTGAIMARELTRAGLQVVALERGPDRNPAEDFALPAIRDELRYSVRQELMQDPKMETVTLRHRLDGEARPVRRFGSFLPGDGVGGMGTHWNGNTFRFLPSDHRLRSHLGERYGRASIPEDMTIQDWGVTYEELEPHYSRFEALCGVSGKAGNIAGKIQAGGNPFEGPRSGEYPNAPLVASHANELFRRAAGEIGLHPFPAPASNASAPYVNPEGTQLGACQYCGHCDRFGCEANAKATPLSTLAPSLRQASGFRKVTNAYATRVLYDAKTRRATGVRYIDLRSGETYDQPADIVVLSAWVFGNTRLMLLSGIGEPYDARTGKGVVGKNYCYQIQPTVQAFFKDEELNPFMGAGGLGMVVDDFNGDNFDHAKLGFFGGGYISQNSTNGRPISFRPTPPGTPAWGAAWKRETANWYRRTATMLCEGTNYPNRTNALDLDPTYRDMFGQPLLRMTFNFTQNDRTMADFLLGKAADIGRAMNATIVAPQPRKGDFNVVSYQSSHNTGGTIMGHTPADSVVNRYLQSWDAHNVFVLGSSVFPQNAGYNPTAAAAAVTYWCADALVKQYLKAPAPLVQL
ncbi:GMC family oxidoreductase [Bradyrhizobium prioriisuperbiae]|uniref:GMC family oxidoreductase n=1 Tax=Bradyrhizobium prioriisuperbiae TaxID=2854389 RepID=UPI0028E8D03E|nr:GMC family oxidoreductase [Bradyrhizobium prioritasuperba]